jgi:tRNA threonylcarbamoyl adenosine modification protein YeaZ
VIENGNTISLIEKSAHRKHAEILPEFIKNAFEESNKSIKNIDAIAISIGPGSFTGLRIGLGTAKGLAYSHDLPIIPIPSLVSLAYGLKDNTPAKGISYSHGKRVFYQEFNWENKCPIGKSKPVVGDIDTIIDKLDTSTFQWNCDSVLLDNNSFIRAIPSAKHVGLLAYELSDKWLIETPYTLVPEYVAPFEISSRVK